LSKATAPPGTRSYSSPRRDQQAEATRQRILEAFAAQLGRPGAGDINVTEAAKAAGVAVRTVYHYFPDRAARVDALVAWTREQFGPIDHRLETADDLAGYTRAAYARAERHEALTRAGIVAGFSSDVRIARHQGMRVRIRELLDEIGAPEADTERAAAMIAVLETSDAGFPLVDSHGLSFSQAADAAADAIDAIIARLRALAAEQPAGSPSKPDRSSSGRGRRSFNRRSS
jgi:AcrR family transcriptional regulator